MHERGQFISLPVEKQIFKTLSSILQGVPKKCELGN